MLRSNVDKENIVQAPTGANVRKGLSVNGAVTKEGDAQRELRKVKVSMTEKDKQLAYFQQQLSLSQARVSELENTNEKMKRSENASRRILSAKEASAKKQGVLIKHVNDRLQQFAKKEDNKLRRNMAAKQELQDELERVEEDFERFMRDAQEECERERQDMDSCLQAALTEKQQEYDDQIMVFQQNTEKLADDYAGQLVTFRESFVGLQQQSQTLASENGRLELELEQVLHKLAESTAAGKCMAKDLEAVRDELASAVKNNEFQVDEVARLRVLNTHIQDDLAAARTSMYECKAAGAESAQQLDVARSSVEALTLEVGTLEQQLADLTVGRQSEQEELVGLRERHAREKSACDQLTDEVGLLRAELLTAQEQCEKVGAAKTEQIEAVARLKDELDMARQRVATLVSVERDKDMSLADLQESVSELTCQQKTTDAKLAATLEELEVTSAQKEECAASVIHLEIQLGQHQEQQQRDAIQASMEAGEKDQQYRQQLDSLEADKRSLETDLADARAALEEHMVTHSDAEAALAAQSAESNQIESEWSETCTYLEQKYTASVDTVSHLEAQLCQRDDAMSALRDAMSALRDAMSALRDAMSALREEIEDLSGQTKELVQGLSVEETRSQQLRSGLENALAAARLELEGAVGIAEAVRRESECAQTDLSEARAQLEATTGELETVKAALRRSSESFNGVLIEFSQFKQLSTDAIASLQSQHKAELGAVRGRLEDTQGQLAAKSTDYAALGEELVNTNELLLAAVADKDEQSELFAASEDKYALLTERLAGADSRASTQVEELGGLRVTNEELTRCVAAQRAQAAHSHTEHTAVSAELVATRQTLEAQRLEWSNMENLWQEESDELDDRLQALQKEVLALKLAKDLALEQTSSRVEQAIAEAEAKLMQAHGVETAGITASSQRELEAVEDQLSALRAEKTALAEVVAVQQIEMATFSKDAFAKLQVELRGCNDKIRELRAEKNTFKSEFERVNAEYAAAVGHINKKQRIHYVDSLKQQLNLLMEENTSLRSKLHN